MKKTPLKSSGKPIKREGASTNRWKGWRVKNKRIVLERSGGRCEWHTGACSGALTWQHCFGRMHIIEEPWASFHPLTTMICWQIHDAADNHDVRIKKMMQREALQRFLETEPFNRLVNWGEINERLITWEPHEILRDIIKDFNARGIGPDAEAR